MENEPIKFNVNDLEGVATPHNDPTVIIGEIGESTVVRLLLDRRAVMNVMYADD